MTELIVINKEKYEEGRGVAFSHSFCLFYSINRALDKE
jgi:hypothetical protein